MSWETVPLMQKPKKYINTGGNQKSGSVKKRKRRSIAGLAKVGDLTISIFCILLPQGPKYVISDVMN